VHCNPKRFLLDLPAVLVQVLVQVQEQELGLGLV